MILKIFAKYSFCSKKIFMLDENTYENTYENTFENTSEHMAAKVCATNEILTIWKILNCEGLDRI